MLKRSASLAMSTSVLEALPGKLDIKRNSPSNLYPYYKTVEIEPIFSFKTTLDSQYRGRRFDWDEVYLGTGNVKIISRL